LDIQAKTNSYGHPPRRKVQLMTCKFQQKQGVEYYKDYIHVVKWETIQIIIKIGAHANWQIQHLDGQIVLIWFLG
jgi:hypothetical protein